MISFSLLFLADVLGRVKVIYLANTIVLLGIAASIFVPIFEVKVLGFAIAAGIESTFGGLYTMVINESMGNTIISNKIAINTPLKSRGVPISFLSYGLGSMIINISALLLNDAGYLLVSTGLLLIVCVIPSFLLLVETPKYLYKKGLIS